MPDKSAASTQRSTRKPTPESEAPESFAGLGLSDPLVRTLVELGYETPTPIQQQTIPLMLSGRDVIGQAQTGTGKTAAFALPILDRIDLKSNAVQTLVLTPTRELAIQVSEAFHTYGKNLGRVRVIPVYGGDSIAKQIGRLRMGVHVVVGTPGRIMDHLRRGTLGFDALRTVVLDEADEMLRMGFLEDIEWILEQAPVERQTALFSATIPRDVRRISEQYLKDPVSVAIHHRTVTVPTVEQQYIQVPERQKLDALTHLLETESTEGETILIFTRTKLGAADLTQKLEARGYSAEAMHGDMTQALREQVIRRMRARQVEIVVATDVAARGLDVEHIGRVINFDIPNDPESYVHRIGRTARAGRAGKAILFVTPRENRMMREIERFTGQRMTPAKVPSSADVARRRMALFKERILKSLHDEGLHVYLNIVEELAEESGCDMAEIAAASARLAGGDKPLIVSVEPEAEQMPPTDGGSTRLFIDIGRNAGVRPSDIVGAIANEAGIPGKAIGAIDIYDDFTFVDVPAAYREKVIAAMSEVMIRNRETKIRAATARDLGAGGKPARRPGARDGGHGGPRGAGPGGPREGQGPPHRSGAAPFHSKKTSFKKSSGFKSRRRED